MTSEAIKPWGMEPENVNGDSADATPASSNCKRRVAMRIFWAAVLASICFIYLAVSGWLDLGIPYYVVVFSIIGGLMYLFASTAGEWETAKEKLKDDPNKLNKFNNQNFYEKLNDFGIQRKALRVLAAPLLAIGIYLLFDLIFVGFSTTTEPANITENSSILEIVTEIQNAGDSEKIIMMKAGISFLVGAFVKQFLTLIRALADEIGGGKKQK
ncbi:hypothetical protein RE474_13320 [Methanolobus sediminis]|uniref:Uncharacterized protein n=1 Tax=Methanolobus sediminis TaxID=3072978 RepID=A0AA51UK60_9EURY|nr:hypothetical protein [Methanolobus sediminis]WMW25042.1 hypothetical protein RE474_13320 [Methanolobus sediminis]